MKSYLLVVLVIALANGAIIPKPKFERGPGRIVGGSVTTINQYPFTAAMMSFNWGFWAQWCGGSILTSRMVLSAAHCFESNLVWDSPIMWQVRVGSTSSTSGGALHQVQLIHGHQNYNQHDMDHDLAIIRIASTIVFINNQVAQVSIANWNYNLPDNQPVWAIGWGQTEFGTASTQLRHVQLWTVNQQLCQSRFGHWVTNNMVCAGVLTAPNYIGQCFGDSGGPLVHNGVLVGICSFGGSCDTNWFPSVNVRVSSFANWIVNTVNQLS